MCCLEGTKAVVRPPTSPKANKLPSGMVTPELLGPTPQRKWNSQSFGKRAASASTLTAARTTKRTASRSSAICRSDSVLAGAAGCTPALCRTSSAIQLPTPHTTLPWSNNSDFTGMLERPSTATKVASAGGATSGSAASSAIGASPAGSRRSRILPNRLGSANATFATLPPLPPPNSSCSLVNRGGQASSTEKLSKLKRFTPSTAREPVMPQWTSKCGPSPPSSNQSCFPRRFAATTRRPRRASTKAGSLTPSPMTLSSNFPSRGPPPDSRANTFRIVRPTACLSISPRIASTSGSSGMAPGTRA
mmetsp:Transcript_72296/g.234759  ORF Transcript_72296/g.234759 Transcript_72296/m.234759 type:complete len:305 (+) Transcript_72296:2198-3112(+)